MWHPPRCLGALKNSIALFLPSLRVSNVADQLMSRTLTSYSARGLFARGKIHERRWSIKENSFRRLGREFGPCGRNAATAKRT